MEMHNSFLRLQCLLNKTIEITACWLLVLLIFVIGVHSTSALAADGKPLSKAEKKQLVENGVAQYEQGHWNEAKQSLEEARKMFPENYTAPYYLGLIYLNEGNTSRAIAQWQHYVSLDPESENSMKIRKNITLLLHEQAQEYARQAIEDESALADAVLAGNVVAVTPFQNLGSADLGPLGKGMAAMVIHDLAQVDDFTVVERIKLQVLLDEVKFGTSGLVDAKTAPQVGKMLKARHVIAGNLADLEKESLQIASVVVDAKRDETIGTQQVQGKLKKFYDLEKDIACGIVEDLGKDCKDMPKAFKRVHTKSLPALSAFSYGLDHFDRQEYDEAREKFQEALDKDPDFDLAQTALIATPFSAMLLMTTTQMISNASNSGVSSSAAGSSVAASAGGAAAAGAAAGGGGGGLGVTAAVVGGAALVGGGVAAALNNTDYIDGDDDDDNGNGNVAETESQFPDVAGNWVGTWTDAEDSANEAAIRIEQDSSALSGTMYVYGSDCISTGSLSGTVTTDNRLNLTITSGTSRISVDATFDSSTSTIAGNYQYETGQCAGGTGAFRLTLNVELPI